VRSYIDVSAVVRDMVELAELAVKAGRLNPVLNEDQDHLTILFIPENTDISYLLELKRCSSGLLWVILRNEEEIVDSWCELHIEPAGEKSAIRSLWKTARSMRVTTDTEEGLYHLEDAFRRLSGPTKAAS